MAYGFSFDKVREVKRGEANKTLYGSEHFLVAEPEFILNKLDITKGKAVGPLLYLEGKRTVYVEHGNILLTLAEEDGEHHELELEKRKLIEIPNNIVTKIEAKTDSTTYIFSSGNTKLSEHIGNINQKKVKYAKNSDIINVKKTFDFREKYWGSIESIVADDYAGKRIFMKKGGQSSLEYHIRKKEAYYIESGKLKVGLRVGRAENRSLILYPGEVYVVPQGLMHMRIALEDSVIMEISTKDDDKDSHLVEDGQKYTHQEVSHPQ